MKAKVIQRARPLKRGQTVTVEVEPGFSVQSFITGFKGIEIKLAGFGWFDRRRVR